MSEKLYLSTYRDIREKITKGTYPFQSKLPSKRTLADQYHISLITCQHAIDLLIQEGYIESRQRQGYYVTYQEDNFYPIKEERIDKLPAVSHEFNTFPGSIYAKAVRKILTEDPDLLSIKSEDIGLYRLRLAIAHYLDRSRGIHVDPSQIIIGSGSEYFYQLIIQLLGRERIYAIENPSYEKIQKMYRANGVRIDPLRMGKDGILTSELNRTPASVLHITPYHSFPSGITASASKRKEYIAWAKNNDGFIIEDDYDSEFAILSKSVDTLFSLEPNSTVFYLNTFSRTISPSLRVSYLVLPKNFIDRYNKKAGFFSCPVSVLNQLTIAELINNGSFERHINRQRRKLRKQSH